jgi:hypothetical protein
MQEPTCDFETVRIPDIPEADAKGMPKGFWDSVVRRLRLLHPGEALHLPISDWRALGVRSSVCVAGAKEGLRITTVYRPDGVYLWISGRRVPRGARPKRKPYPCVVCGSTVEPGWTGNAGMYCRGRHGVQSACKRIAEYARYHGVTIAEAMRRREERRAA